MKKIVALVLSLVMVLGLATTAMAVPNTYLADLSVGYNVAVNDFTGFTGTTTTGALDLADYDLKLEQQVPEISVNDEFAKQVLWAYDKETKAPFVLGYFVIAASATSADYAFVNGGEITYLVEYAGATDDWTVEVALVPTVDYVLVENCGEIYTSDDAALYTTAGEVLYLEVAGGSTVGYVDGKYVELEAVDVAGGDLFTNIVLADVDDNAATAGAGEVVIVAHTYKYDAKTVNGANIVTKAYCSECDAEFAFVQGYESEAIAKFGAGKYTKAVEFGAKDLWVAKVAGAATDAPAVDTTDKVESAETFDAGIAMYVGMSVMAAAGSAVVLKKKD